MIHALAIGIGFVVMLEGYWSIEDSHPTVAKVLVIGATLYGVYAAARMGKMMKAGK